MELLSLNDNGFYKELSKRKSNKAIKYTGLLQPIALDANYFLEYIKNAFPEYPDHGIQHSYRILGYLSQALESKIIKNMSDTELFCLIMAALFHDTGMALYTSEEVDQIRKKHHKFASQVLDKYFEEKLSILEERDRIKSVIQFACEAHGMEIQEVYGDEIYHKTNTVGFDAVRYGVLASLIRIGDLMDLDNDRVNEFVLINFLPSFSRISQKHNTRHSKVLHYNPKKMEIEVRADDKDEYHIWMEWLGYMKNEILCINTYLRQDNIFFHPLKENIKDYIRIPDDANFETEEIRLEMDDSGNMLKILSQSIYTDELDFLRELVQNAIDATLYNLYCNSSVRLEHISPRDWHKNLVCQNVFVGYSQKRKELFIQDAGIGMNRSELKHYLFKVASSGYSESEKEPFPFPGIAQFGIGFVSCLVNAYDIEIFTKKSDNKVASHVSLISNNNQATIEDYSLEVKEGTTIHLKLKQDFSYDRIKEYLEQTFLYPSVGITCVDIDCMEKLSERLKCENKFIDIIKKPYKLRNNYRDFKMAWKEEIEPYNINEKLYKKVLERVEAFNRQLEYDNWIEDYNKKIKILEEKIKENQKELPEEILEEFRSLFTRAKSFDSSDPYVRKDCSDQLKRIEKRLKESIKRVNVEQTSLQLNNLEVTFSKVSMGYEWKYCICELDDKLEFTSIEFVNKAVDLSKKKGIIFLYHEDFNYDEGYEYASLNGFLFCEGKICNHIARLVGVYENQIAHERYEKTYIKGYCNEPDFEEDWMEECYGEDMENDDYIAPCDEFTLEPEMKTIFINQNLIKIEDDVSKDEFSYCSSAEDKGDSRFMPGNYSSHDFQVKNFFVERVDDFEKMINAESFVLCQDGIRFHNVLMGLCPVGLFKIHCNLTANARMILNISRHKFSEIEGDVKPWVKSTGLKIQKSILNKIKEAVSDVSLEIDFKELFRDYGDKDVVSESLMKQFKDI